ncbi:chlorite dismutase family protein [Egibacter rhizosphaerae]|uniref:chlorite dismutase family protein n=1 Tax=Egibacter rhizosphaerae TaxID=1670831 RepID=UPI0013F16E2D|nr:chlorite dismutase family protein [Egibacter rhizosphaerae]
MPSVVPTEGWGVLHLFFHVRRELLEGAQGAARDFAGRLKAFDDRDGYQVLAFSVLGQKADFGVMALGPDLAALDGLHTELAGSPLGQALLPAASYLSLTELSDYGQTEEEEVERLRREGIEPGTDAHEEQLAAFRERMEAYARHRLYPDLPQRQVIGFYPMSKRRGGEHNWYLLDFEQRRRLMGAHAQTGRRFSDRITQLITASTGLDDWEWGVTLLADDPKALKDVVYTMRFDEVSARYSDFGPFVTGLVCEPDELFRHLHLT